VHEMLKELGVERFRFTCAHCQYTWITDYDVQHVEDGHGHDCAYYSLNGVPVTAPTAPAAYLCPGCGASRIQVTLIARRDIPLAPDPAAAGDTTWPLQVDTAERRITRHQAPPLPGQQPPAPT